MEKERLAEYLEQYHLGEFNAATSRELELTFGIKGIEVRHLVNQLRRTHRQQWERLLLRRHRTGGSGHHRPPDPADQRHRRRYPRAEPLPGTVRHGADLPPAGRR